MTGNKRHLLAPSTVGKAACGTHHPRLTTRDPARVTCKACVRTQAMADAQIRTTQKPFRST